MLITDIVQVPSRPTQESGSAIAVGLMLATVVVQLSPPSSRESQSDVLPVIALQFSADSFICVPLRLSAVTLVPSTMSSPALWPRTAGLFPPNALTIRVVMKSADISARRYACFFLMFIRYSIFPF